LDPSVYNLLLLGENQLCRGVQTDVNSNEMDMIFDTVKNLISFGHSPVENNQNENNYQLDELSSSLMLFNEIKKEMGELEGDEEIFKDDTELDDEKSRR